MKKIKKSMVVAIMCLTLVFSLSACGSSNASKDAVSKMSNKSKNSFVMNDNKEDAATKDKIQGFISGKGKNTDTNNSVDTNKYDKRNTEKDDAEKSINKKH